MIKRTLGFTVAFAVLVLPAQTWGAGTGAGRVTFNPFYVEPVKQPPPPPPPPPPHPSVTPQNSLTTPMHPSGSAPRGH